jgi:ABC-type multidrug transport system fused ATPase/permease subunit
VRKRILIGLGVVAAVAVLTYLSIDVILATFVTIIVAAVVLVWVAGSDWQQHSTFEQRELDRARKRAAKWDRTADARAKDRARWEAHQAKRAARDEG